MKSPAGSGDRAEDSTTTSPGGPARAPRLDADGDLVAYFCMEFGLYEGLKLYSGGMGILAGDHIKAASDLDVPLVAVGLLYHQGYFDQTIDSEGQQEHSYERANFAELPVSPAIGADGKPFQVHVELPGRTVGLNVWKVRARQIDLFLLDSDVPDNDRNDREITFQLYGGGRRTRLEQEIVLGIGGVRALRAMGYEPTVWHSNEGHSAFQILERCRELVGKGHDFETALELAAANTVFTTHTPVPAGHDMFDVELVREYFAPMIDTLGISMERLLALGGNARDDRFNMTALAFRGSRFHNAVSRIHRDVAAHLDSYVWPQVPPLESPLRYVTNGVHAATFLAPAWEDVFSTHLSRRWRERVSDAAFWGNLESLPDELLWNVRRLLKRETLAVVEARSMARLQRNRRGPNAIGRATRYVTPDHPDVLLVGFARRFATYKRANLVFREPERLARLLGNEDRPVVLIYAGKAHPRDQQGQQYIRFIHDMSNRPEFEGRVLLLEGYDMRLAKNLLRGVDVWLNTPEYPLEACGTSGMKAGMNGVLNLSVLDGWWAEGFDTRNGWAIFPRVDEADPELRNAAEADELMSLLEEQVVPAYYDRDEQGVPRRWISMVKASMRSVIPRFNASRMIADYERSLYGPAAAHGRALWRADAAPARALSAWKQELARRWPGVALRRLDRQPGVSNSSPTPPIRVAADLAGLEPEEVVVECVWGAGFDTRDFVNRHRKAYRPSGDLEGGEVCFELDLEAGFAGTELGRMQYRVRAYPRHPDLAHPFEPGLMIWLS